MPSTPYMKFYIGDYLGDTQHLSCLEHGAYILLIMAYWQNGGPIKNDPKILRRLTRTSPNEFKKCSENVLKMFHSVDGMLVHKRVDLELAKRTQVSITATNAANTRWCERNADASKNGCGRNATPIVHSPESREEKNKSMCTSYSPDIPEPIPETQDEPGAYVKMIFGAWGELGDKAHQPNDLWTFSNTWGRDIAPHVKGIHSGDVLQAIANYKTIITAPKGTYYWNTRIGIAAFMSKHLEKFLPANFNVNDFKTRTSEPEEEPEEIQRREDKAARAKKRADEILAGTGQHEDEPDVQVDTAAIAQGLSGWVQERTGI